MLEGLVFAVALGGYPIYTKKKIKKKGFGVIYYGLRMYIVLINPNIVEIAQLTQQHTVGRRASIQHQLQKNNTNNKDHRQNRNTSIQTKFREKCILYLFREIFLFTLLQIL